MKIPCVDFFAYSTENSCSVDDIKSFQLIILKELQFKIQWPTLETWGNYLTYQWDAFIMNEDNTMCNGKIRHLPKFRNDDKLNYSLLINFFMVLDAISLDYYYVVFDEKVICLCIMYLLVGIALEFFNIEIIINFFKGYECSNSFVCFHGMFVKYIQHEYNVKVEGFRHTLEYVSQFFNIIFDYSAKPNKDTSMVRLNYIYTYIYMYAYRLKKSFIKYKDEIPVMLNHLIKYIK